jgi:molybdenum cofactor biosynthesis enzyme MoaA
MPFVTLTVNPGNYISRCMMSWENMGPVEKSTYSNDNFQKLRTNMLNGVWDKEGCESCYFKEQNGLTSQRTKWLDREEKYLRETGIYEANKSINRNKIYHLYMNFNNICNFKCRMCGPHFSNAWIPDYNKMYEGKKQSFITPKQQVDVHKFLQEYGDELSDLRQIWITGGEPFMDNSVYEFFEQLENYCPLENINVTINTNASKVDTERLSNLHKLRKLHINVSVDSTHEYYTYMRGYNYTFDELDKKIRSFVELKQEQNNMLVTINGAFQIYNILNIEDFFHWANDVLRDDTAGFIEHRVLTGPSRFQARHAPQVLKDQSKEQVARLIEQFPDQFYLPDIMLELNKSADPVKVQEFCDWNGKVDNIRNEKVTSLLPDLFELWKQEGYL